MKKVSPYQNLNTALKSLDNGGRFYNILTKAEDGIINQAEIGKVGNLNIILISQIQNDSSKPDTTPHQTI